MSDERGRLDIEWIAIKAGLKPANRITISPERAADVEVRAKRAGFAVERGARLVEFPGRPPSMILYVSPDAARARELVEIEEPLLRPEGEGLPVDESIPVHARLGALLGFPPCCVDEFCARLRRGVTRRLDGRAAHEDFVAAECAKRASQRFLGRLNDLSPDRHARIITFYPCRYDCRAASTYAAGVFNAAVRTDRRAAAALRDALLGTMRIGVDGARGREAAEGGEVLTIEFEEL